MKCANDQAMKKYFAPLLLLFLLVTQISCVPGAYRTPWDSPSAQTGKAAQAPHVLLNSGTYATVEPQQDSYLTEAAAQANTDQGNTHIETAQAPAAQQGAQDTTATAPQDQGSADDIVVAQSYSETLYAEQNAEQNKQAYTQGRTSNRYGQQKQDAMATSPSIAPPAGRNTSITIALLAPLSGEQKNLGQGLLQSAQMAMFELDAPNINLLPRDTKGTQQGAEQAVQSAIDAGAHLIIGPLFSHSVRAAKPYARRADVPMVAFTTDWTLADRNTFIMSFLPFAQVQRIAEYAHRMGYENIGILTPNTEYGNAVIAAYNSMAYRLGMPTAQIVRFSPEERDISGVVKEFAHYDQRKLALEEKILETEEYLATTPNDFAARAELAKLEEMTLLGEPPYDAVLLPVGGEQARTIGNLLSFYEMPPSTVKRLGTGLWDEEGLATEPGLEGSWFAAPPPQSRAEFERRYRDIYGQAAPRLATLSYDTMALAIALSRYSMAHYAPSSDHTPFKRDTIINPNGFAGIDGIFRFRNDGLVERGIAVMEFQDGQIKVIDPAPRTFQKQPQASDQSSVHSGVTR
jgi:hypothetical protein